LICSPRADGVNVLDAQDPPRNWYDAGLRHLWLASGGIEPLAVALTHGARIVLDDERELLDGTAGGWTACHGFNHPHIGMAVARQLERMPHAPLDGMIHQQPAKLAARLAQRLPGDLDHVLFAESGSAAIEAALAVARRHAEAQGRGARRVLTFRSGWLGGTVRLPRDEKSIAAFERSDRTKRAKNRRHRRRAADRGARHEIPRCGSCAVSARAPIATACC
jgi:4-aminobutyrate aminotransferase-like enzyme